MNEELWKAICAAFEEVLEAPAERRVELLERLGREDPKLRGEVESLLGWHANAEGFLQSAPRMIDSEPSAGEELPRELDRYRLLEVLGRGGMSVVYLAERIDGEYDKRVAIKLLPRGVESAELVGRMRAERQILAGLEHGGIARLLDGGTTPQGDPYLVMELVEGERIDRYCQARALSIEARLRLFLGVCAAVRYAHQRLLVHRDIKPANILVTASGEPKLLDFGISKLLSVSDADPPTLGGIAIQRPMTPEYASPEQVSGAAVTTASDIYSLGALLYELLTGRRAHRISSRTPIAIVRAVCHDTPAEPSAVVLQAMEPDGERVAEGSGSAGAAAARRLSRRLAGDLDAIVLRALRKDPQLRYASVDDLARDVEAYLAGQPVRARGAAWAYRTRKFLRRHRLRLVVAAVVLAALGGLSWRLLRNQRQAEEQRRRADSLSTFLETLFSASDPREAQGKSFTPRELLARAAAQLEEGLADQPRVHAGLLDQIGRIHVQLGLYAEAEPRLKRALELRRASAVPPHELSASLAHLGNLYVRQANFEAAKPVLLEAIEIGRKASIDEHPGLILTLAEMGFLERRQGRALEAPAYLEEALALARRRVDLPKHPDLRDDNPTTLAYILNELAACRTDLSQYRLAEALQRESLAIYRQRYAPPHPYLATSTNNLGRILLFQGRYDDAREPLSESLEMQRQLYDKPHPNNVTTLSMLATVEEYLGRFAQARPLRTRALALAREVFGESHLSTVNQELLDATLRARTEPAEAAEPRLREAVANLRQRQGDKHRATCSAAEVWTEPLLEWGYAGEVEQQLAELEPVCREVVGERHIAVAGMLGRRAQALVALADPAGAEPLLARALEITAEVLGSGSEREGQLLFVRGLLHERRRELAAAEADFQQARELLAPLGPAHPRVARAAEAMARVERARAEPR